MPLPHDDNSRQVDGRITPADEAESVHRLPDKAIEALASAQHGRVATWQLLLGGVSKGAIERRAAQGRLLPVGPGVFAVGHRAGTLRSRWVAAVLARGAGALLSHTTGGALHDVLPVWDSVHVSVARPGRERQDGVTVHRLLPLAPQDRTVVDGIPVTSLARTFVDCAPLLSPRQLQTMVTRAMAAGTFDLAAIDDVLRRLSRPRGVVKLRAVLAAHRDLGLTASALEDAFVTFCDRHAIPDHLRNQPVITSPGVSLRPDAFWPRERVAVELDSFAYHQSPVALQEDRHRDTQYALAGIVRLRLTAHDLTPATAQELTKLLNHRRWTDNASPASAIRPSTAAE